ncbi:unnamed protein product [Rhizophagus irregularis]|uniref:Uncharacterized protein n=1 Tax=Rhizophagus irregularis TaxID=588596 RepID=A0A2N1N1X4_9GLOM|nr:hypothetical protein RhiirC2_851822 [Rhizophagus irregularis]CAB4382610.1 unnamed protein product [Rhizophagus irregularis]CAB5371753.1 unnamed protein product [Rhizophagus irregularis]
MSKETKRESINDNLEMILSCEQVRKLLSKFSFDYYEIRLWKDQIEIPIGVSMEPFVIREVILHGLYFQHLKLYPEFECKKGQIPSWVNERAASVEPGKLIPGIAKRYPDHIIIYKVQKPPKYRDQTTMLELLKIKPNQRFLYHGVRTSIIIPFFIAYARPYSNAINNEFGPGIYCTPNFDVAVEYSGRNGAIFVYDWSDLGGDSITTKTLSGKEWADTVKGHICIADITRPSPPLHEEDIIQGLITSNNNSIYYHYCNPIQSEKFQIVATTDNGMNELASRLYGIIYLC